MERWIGVSEAARQLGISTRQVRRLISEGKLPARRACLLGWLKLRPSARRAVSGTPFSGLSDKMVGPLVYGFSSDPVAAAKVLAGFAMDNDKLVVKAGAMPNYVMDEKGVKALATMPSREELLAKLMATMQAPIAQFVRTLNEVPSRLARTLAAVRDTKEGATA